MKKILIFGYIIILMLFCFETFAVSKADTLPPLGKENVLKEEMISEEGEPTDENQTMTKQQDKDYELQIDNRKKTNPQNTKEEGMGIAIKPQPRPRYFPRLKTSIWTNSDVYRIGDNVRIYFRVSRAAYVYIYNTDAQGITRQIFPNYFDRDNFIYPGWTYYIPDQSYRLTVNGPRGRESLQIVAVSKRYRIFDNYHQFRPAEPFPQFQGGGREIISKFKSQSQIEERAAKDKKLNAEERAKQIYPEPRLQVIPSPSYNDYAEDWTYFEVTGPYYDYDDDWDNDWDNWDDSYFPQDYGALFIKTDPTGAIVRIDNLYRGKSPFRINLRPGTYRVAIEKQGYRTWYSSVRIRKDQTTDIRVKLIRNFDYYYDNNYKYEENIKIRERNKKDKDPSKK